MYNQEVKNYILDILTIVVIASIGYVTFYKRDYLYQISKEQNIEKYVFLSKNKDAVFNNFLNIDKKGKK